MDSLEKLYNEINKLVTGQAVMSTEITNLKQDVEKLFTFIDGRFVQKEDFKEFHKTLDDEKKGFVTKTEFEPIKRIVYGMVSIILLTVLGLIISNSLKN